MTYYPTGNSGKIYRRRKRVLNSLTEPMTIKRLAELCKLTVGTTKNDVEALIIERSVKFIYVNKVRMICQAL